MLKEAVSVTLSTDNLLWLRGQAHAQGSRSLSAVLDHLISAARTNGQVHAATVRSVVGTVQISGVDPELRGADAAIRALFPAPLAPETVTRYRSSRTTLLRRKYRRRTS